MGDTDCIYVLVLPIETNHRMEREKESHVKRYNASEWLKTEMPEEKTVAQQRDVSQQILARMEDMMRELSA